ncbi:MAG: hypothetical protein ACE3JQ_02420 [Paenisporosarcina sp.]
MVVRALENIRHSGKTFKAGDVVKGLSKKDEKRLLDLKSVETIITAEEVKSTVVVLDVDPVKFKELRDALDENYNADELKRAAKEVKVELDVTDTTKEKVMEAIIKQGKADELLEDDDDDSRVGE